MDGADVAIKRLRTPFASKMTVSEWERGTVDGQTEESAVIDVDVQARRLLREVRLLKQMRHDCIVQASDVYTPQTSYKDFNDV